MSIEQAIQVIQLIIAVLIGYCIGLYDAFRMIRKRMKSKE